MKSIPEIFAKADAFETKYMSGVCTPGQDLKAYFQTELKIFDSTAVDRDLTRRVCDMIAVRAARLASAGLCAIMESIGKTEKCTIAVDGSLYTLFPGFKEKMEAVFREEYPGKVNMSVQRTPAHSSLLTSTIH
jgi:hexokinase